MLHLFKDIMLVLQLTCNGLQIAQMGDTSPRYYRPQTVSEGYVFTPVCQKIA